MALGPDDWAIRCNLMTIRDGRLTDFTAGHITSEEGRPLMEALQAALGRPERRVPRRGQLSQPDDLPRQARRGAGSPTRRVTDPPHDHPDQPAAEHLPRGAGADLLNAS